MMVRFQNSPAVSSLALLAVLMAFAAATAYEGQSQTQFENTQRPTTTNANITEEGDKTCIDSREQPGKISESNYVELASSDVMKVQSQVPTEVDANTSKEGEPSDVGIASSSVMTIPKDFGAEFGEVQTMFHTTASNWDMPEMEKMSKFLDKLQSMYIYMTKTVFADETYRDVKDICRNKHASCVFWAAMGECKNSAAFMLVNCAPVCHSCEMWRYHERCPLDPNAMDVFVQPGDVNNMFARIISDPFYNVFQPKVLSRPDLAPGDTEETAKYKVGGPWMLLFENAISDEEADRLIELGDKLGYERSDTAELLADGTWSGYLHEARTSTNAFCKDECNDDPMVQNIMNRIVNITGVPLENSELLQILQYEKDQWYTLHSDYLPFEKERQAGARVLTFFIYASDVEEGGETSFPNVGLKIQPKKGQAVLWPSVLDEDPNSWDQRTDHTALPVIKGVKYGINAWLHQRDYMTPWRNGCA